jgi:hypothetical protein
MKWHYVLLAAVIVLFASYSHAEHAHDEGHDDYSGWSSKKTANCCNSNDCGYLKEDEWRETPQATEVKILGKWCPVKPEHYITKGKSPDRTKAHACVTQGGYYQDNCERLLCFSGMPSW